MRCLLYVLAPIFPIVLMAYILAISPVLMYLLGLDLSHALLGKTTPAWVERAIDRLLFV